MRLQAGLHGLPKAEAQSPRRRADRAGRALRGGRPQGRRLLGRHEAAPRPRAGAGPRAARSCSSTSRPPASTCRAAPRSGTRSQRLAGDDGVTVFLTTQYLEEADALADRVGIIDNGKIVAEGTPDALKAEIGRPDRRGGARRRGRAASGCATVLGALRRPSAPAAPGARRGAPRRGRRRARRRRPRARRRGDPGRRPRAPRPEPRRRLPRQDRPPPRGRRRRRRRGEHEAAPA